MPDVLRCFVNECGLSLSPGATVRDAVTAFDPALADRIARAEAYVTDARGIRVAPEQVLAGGAILRVVSTSRTPVDAPDA